jgi:Icc-related predicted phosphoesterase
MSRGTLLIISDIHTHYSVINSQILHAEEICGHAVDLVLVSGDFGFFGDELHDYFRAEKQRFLKPVFCIDGNHEDHGAIEDLARAYADEFTYLSRGTVHRLGPWRCLCLGGASYMNSSATPRGSEITHSDVEACLAHSPDAVDMVLSHDCPAGIGVPSAPGMEHYGSPGEPRMGSLKEHFHPRFWFFGHHHRWFDSAKKETRYIGLPQSWVGYVLLHSDGEIEIVQHDVPVESSPWWKRFFWWRVFKTAANCNP